MSGIYVHIPFCKQACYYCNFHFSTTLHLKNELVQAICKEISLTCKDEKTDLIDTIYFGGGTPSILEIKEIEQIISTLDKHFIISPNAEITLEANPDDITGEKLRHWKETGINRLSVGIQSFSDAELKWMNRVHNAAHSLRCIEEIQEAGFTNFSVDLIYGSPLLTNEDWEKNTSIIIDQKIPHVSCYALTVEPSTALDKMIAQKKKEPVNAEKQSEQFLLLMSRMKEAGYEHYEISNFAKPGMRSKHNSSYWQGKKYYGFGPSAHSFDGERRRWNVSNNALYIKSIQKETIPFEEEVLTTNQQLNEYIMTSLRTLEGLDINFVHQKFGTEKIIALQSSITKWKESDKIKQWGDRVILTDEGKLFADGIAADLFFE